MKQIIVTFDFPGTTTKQYDKIMDDLNSMGILGSSGLITHTCGSSSKGIFVCDIWESEEALNKFGETLFPLLAKHKIKAPHPEIYPVHNMVTNMVHS